MLPAASATKSAVAKYFAAEQIVGFNLSQHGHSSDLFAQLLKFGRSDVRCALKNGSILLTHTKIGPARVEYVSEKIVRVTYATGPVREIVTGTVAEVAPILASLYTVNAVAE